MKNSTCILLLAMAVCSVGKAQQKSFAPVKSGSEIQPFLFSVNTLTQGASFWNFNYSGSYGESVSGPFGYNGVDQHFALKGYFGNRFTLYANLGLGLENGGSLRSAQQAEVIRDFFGGKKLLGPRLGLGIGVSRDYTNVKSLFSRITGSLDALNWRLTGNLRLEKAFDSNRDEIDLVTSAGFHHRIAGGFFAGVEAVGEDLEGFWDKEEAEGGARLLIGPSLNLVPENSRLAFSLCGGPVFYATRSIVPASGAIRELQSANNGYIVRAQVAFSLHN
ncbi:hypothetical protein GS399_06595 [Pedobacter sp. HMF7647]|uniref:Outer membrane beta-barrel protein n=1 Tax=Hufsiella arboris TaxID=2695275 RepID=A0A7K1Y7U4_9SPHI|nr:hypothetical protein [Hufsiella arboris]MXV50636.1 hypothetical protein [Hufsiella arboris]